jgi:hypothetical protein
MSSSQNTKPDEIKPESAPAESQDSNTQTPDQVVLQDECGDSLWDKVLAQHPDLTTIINRQNDQTTSSEKSEITKSEE